MKKLFILLLSLSLPIMANAYDACIDGIYYNFNKEEKTATVTYKELKTEPYTYPTVITDYSGDIVIPSTVTYEGEPYVVNEIGNYAFESCSLTSLTIPSTITAINSGFGQISVVKISDLAVWCNIDFRPYLIQSSRTSTSVQLSSNPLFYGAQLYVNGELITTDLVIPKGVETIGTYAFYGFKTLESVTIPSTIKEIGNGAFKNCSMLASVNIKDMAAWCSIDFSIEAERASFLSTFSPPFFNRLNVYSNPLYVAKHLFLDGKEVTDLIIPEGVEKIGSWTFYNCDTLKSVTFPSTLKEIGHGAFAKCKQLKEIHIPDIKSWCEIDFEETPLPEYLNCYDEFVYSDGEVYKEFINNPLYNAKHLYIDGKEVTDLVIPEGTEKIGNYSFCGCEAIKSVTIPSTIKSVGQYAFDKCEQFAEVYINDLKAWCGLNLSSKNNPIYYASHLFLNGKEIGKDIMDLVIPEGVTTIGDYTFYNCDGVEAITIPSTVTSIGDKAFSYFNTLRTVKSFIKEPYNVACFSQETCRQGKLYVPYNTKELYVRFDGWREFLRIEEMEEGATIAPNGRCATPTIVITNNKVRFECETPDAEFTSTITATIEEHSGSEVTIGNDNIVFTITVYANAPGYEQSKPATATMNVSRGDVNVDGSIDVADIATIISIMASKSREERIIEQ